jgi:hypothetical protein
MNNLDFKALAKKLARAEAKKISRLIAAGYTDLAEKVIDGEIDIDSAMQVFSGQRP